MERKCTAEHRCAGMGEARIIYRVGMDGGFTKEEKKGTWTLARFGPGEGGEALLQDYKCSRPVSLGRFVLFKLEDLLRRGPAGCGGPALVYAEFRERGGAKRLKTFAGVSYQGGPLLPGLDVPKLEVLA